MKITKSQLEHVLREAINEAGIFDKLRSKFRRKKKRKPLPGEDTTPLDMSGLTKYDKKGPGIFSGPLGTAKWNRMQKDQDLKSIEAAGDIGAKPEDKVSEPSIDDISFGTAEQSKPRWTKHTPQKVSAEDRARMEKEFEAETSYDTPKLADAYAGKKPKFDFGLGDKAPDSKFYKGSGLSETFERWKKMIK